MNRAASFAIVLLIAFVALFVGAWSTEGHAQRERAETADRALLRAMASIPPVRE